MEANEVSPQPFEKKESSMFSKLLNVYAAPGDVFESIKDTPKKSSLWMVPSLLGVILGILFTLIVFSDPAIVAQLQDSMEKRLEKMVAEGQIPPERVDAVREQMVGGVGGATTKVFGSIGVIIYVFGSLLVVSLAMFLVGKLAFKTTVQYGKVMEVVGLSFMINYVLGSIVTMLTVLAMGSLYATPGLALAITDFDPNNKTHVLISSINIFSLWYLAVLSIGLGKMFNSTTVKAATWVISLWIVWTLLTTFVISIPGM